MAGFSLVGNEFCCHENERGKEALSDLYRGYICLGSGWEHSLEVRVQSLVCAQPRLKMALGCSSSPNPSFPQLLQCWGRAGGELGVQPFLALLQCVLMQGLTQALPHGSSQAQKLQHEPWMASSPCRANPHNRGGMLSLPVPGKG